MRRVRPRPPSGPELFYRSVLRKALARSQDQILAIIDRHLGDLIQDGAPLPPGPRVRILSNPRTMFPGLGSVSVIVDPKDLDRVSGRTEKHSAKEAKRLIGIPSRINPATLKTFRKVNTDLIKSLGKDQVKHLTKVLNEGFEKGTRVEDLRAQIKESLGVSKSKADLIARDQVLKLNGQMARERHKNAGITRYRWSTSGDERVREMHAELDGTIQSYDDPPIVSEDGETGHPGEDIQCRCVAIPVLDDPVED